jgi:hypothetical protein
MAKDKRDAAEATELRSRAEELLRANTAESPPFRTEAGSRRLLHELEVHLIAEGSDLLFHPGGGRSFKLNLNYRRKKA